RSLVTRPRRVCPGLSPAGLRRSLWYRSTATHAGTTWRDWLCSMGPQSIATRGLSLLLHALHRARDLDGTGTSARSVLALLRIPLTILAAVCGGWPRRDLAACAISRPPHRLGCNTGRAR